MSALASRTAMSRDSTPSVSLRCWSALCLSSRHTCAVWPVTKLTGKYTAVSSIRQLSKGEEMGTRYGGWCKKTEFLNLSVAKMFWVYHETMMISQHTWLYWFRYIIKVTHSSYQLMFYLYSYPDCRIQESQDKRNWPNLGHNSKQLRNTGIGGW